MATSAASLWMGFFGGKLEWRRCVGERRDVGEEDKRGEGEMEIASIEEGIYLSIERIMSVRGGGRPGMSPKVDILLRFEK